MSVGGGSGGSNLGIRPVGGERKWTTVRGPSKKFEERLAE